MINEQNKDQLRVSNYEDYEARRIAKNKRDNAYQKASGYSAQKKYRSKHRHDRYEVKVSMPASNKDAFAELQKATGLTISDIMLGAVLDKYGIDFRKAIDKT